MTAAEFAPPTRVGVEKSSFYLFRGARPGSAGHRHADDYAAEVCKV